MHIEETPSEWCAARKNHLRFFSRHLCSWSLHFQKVSRVLFCYVAAVQATMVYLSATSVAFFVTFQLDASFKHVSADIPSGAIRTRSESCDVETLSTTRFVLVKHLHVKCFLSFWYSASRFVVLCLLLCTLRTYLPTGDLMYQSAPHTIPPLPTEAIFQCQSCVDT